MQRISVVGSSGSGKSTMAQAISAKLGVPWLELDSVFHQPNWTELPTDEFQARTREFVDQPAWVVDGNYSSRGVNEIVWTAADTVVWMDLPRIVVIQRLIRRSLYRAATKQELWNGNTESWRNLTRWDPHDNILRWSWTRHHPTRERYEKKIADPRWGHLRVHRLQSRSAARQFVEALHG